MTQHELPHPWLIKILTRFLSLLPAVSSSLKIKFPYSKRTNPKQPYHSTHPNPAPKLKPPHKLYTHIITLLLLTLGLTGGTAATTNTLTITGKVTDPSGKPLSASTVTLHRIRAASDNDRRTVHTTFAGTIRDHTLTDKAGNYTFNITRDNDLQAVDQLLSTYMAVAPTSGPVASKQLMETVTAEDRDFGRTIRNSYKADLKLTSGSLLRGTIRSTNGRPL